MRYLKTFESTSLTTPISQYEADKLIDDMETFTDSEFVKIWSIWDKKPFIPYTRTCATQPTSGLTIFKIRDEWFVVSIQRYDFLHKIPGAIKKYNKSMGTSNQISNYYKCDGWDGLISFLNDQLKQKYS